jgi:hypothetical protein
MTTPGTRRERKGCQWVWRERGGGVVGIGRMENRKLVGVSKLIWREIFLQS